MTKFEFDEELAWDNLTNSLTIALSKQEATLYAVICTNDAGQSSHGGFIVPSAKAAVDDAKEANRLAPEEHMCKYLPVAIMLDAKTWTEIIEDGAKPKGDDVIGNGGYL